MLLVILDLFMLINKNNENLSCKAVKGITNNVSSPQEKNYARIN